MGGQRIDRRFNESKRIGSVIPLMKYAMRYIPYTNTTIKDTPQYLKLSHEKQHELDVLSYIFRYKTNNYIVNELIDWENYENDPIFTLNFPKKEMLDEYDYTLLSKLTRDGAVDEIVKNYAKKIKLRIMPQQVPRAPNLIEWSEPKGIPGLHHQFPKTILAFSAGAKSCYAHCMYCYRWPMFVVDKIHFYYSNPRDPISYLHSHPEVSDILFTGGDALHMSAEELKKFVLPLLEIDSVRTIRLGTRTLSWWPYRFVTDHDADDLCSFFKFIISKGKHVALMAHISHARELSTDIVQKAIRRIRSTGAVIRCQCPIVKGINDSKEVWVELLEREIQLGLIPYYMFVESSNTSNPVFKIPLASALQIYHDAQKELSGLSKTLRGPVLINGPFKLLIDGVLPIDGEKYFVLKYLQSTNADMNGKIVLAHYDERATCFEQLSPAFGKDTLF